MCISFAFIVFIQFTKACSGVIFVIVQYMGYAMASHFKGPLCEQTEDHELTEVDTTCEKKSPTDRRGCPHPLTRTETRSTFVTALTIFLYSVHAT